MCPRGLHLWLLWNKQQDALKSYYVISGTISLDMVLCEIDIFGSANTKNNCCLAFLKKRSVYF